MDLKDRLERSQTLLRDARAILDSPTVDNDGRIKAKGFLDEAQKLKDDADALITIDQMGGTIADQVKALAQPGGGKAVPQFKVWGQFLTSVHRKTHEPSFQDARLIKHLDEVADPIQTGREEKDMSGNSGVTGGYLIPDEFRAQLMSVSAENSIVRPRATIIPMRRRAVTMPALDQTQSLAVGVPRWFGGLTFHWIGEGQSKPESDARFRDLTLVAKKLVGFTRASDELLADAAISLEAFLSSPLGLAGGISWMEDYAFLWGTGVAQPLGIFNSPALITINRERANEIDYLDLVRMMAHVMPSARTEWVISQTALPSLMAMKDPAGFYIWGTATEGGAPRLLGLPYRVSEKMKPVGQLGDILLADFSFYLIGDRQATTVETTPYEAWQEDKTSWRAVHRVDGQPWLNSPLTYADGSTTVGPFVALHGDVS